MSKRDERKKRRRKAAAAFRKFHKRLRRACDTFETVDEWYKFINEFRSLLQEYENDLPANVQQRLNNATELIDRTREGIQRTCQILSKEIERAIKTIDPLAPPPPPPPPPRPGIPLVAKIGGIVAAIAIVAIIFYSDDGGGPQSTPIAYRIEISPLEPIDGDMVEALPITLSVEVSAKSSTLSLQSLPTALFLLQDANVDFYLDDNSVGSNKSDPSGHSSVSITNFPGHKYGKHEWYATASKLGYDDATSSPQTFTYVRTSPPPEEIEEAPEEPAKFPKGSEGTPVGGIVDVKYEGKIWSLRYSLTNGKIERAFINAAEMSLVLELSTDSTRNGTLKIDLLRQLIDAKTPDGQDRQFDIIIDGDKSLYLDVSAYPEFRTLEFIVPHETKEVEIVGTQIGSGIISEGEALPLDKTDVFVGWMEVWSTPSDDYSIVHGQVSVSNDKREPVPNAKVTVKMTDPERRIMRTSAVTNAEGIAEVSFQIFYTGAYTLSVENITGENIQYNPSKNTDSPVTITVK